MFNFWQVSVFLSLLLYGFFCDSRVLYIWSSIFAVYHIIAFLLGHRKANGVRKTIRIASWDCPRDPNVYVKLEIDLTKTDLFLEKYNKKHSGKRKLTYTHFALKACGMGMKAKPRDFGKIVWGK
jgi:hypothetical protein